MSRSREISFSLAVLVLGLLTLAKVIADLAIWSRGTPGPGFFPALVLGMVVLLSGAILLTAILGHPDEEDYLPASPVGLVKVIAYAVMMIGFAFLFEHLGFVLSSLAFLVLLLLVVERQALPITLAVSLGAVVVAYLVFVSFLKVPLPMLGIGPL